MQKIFLGLAAATFVLSACTPAVSGGAAPSFLAKGQQWRMTPPVNGTAKSAAILMTVGSGARQRSGQYGYVQRTALAGGITIVDSFQYAPSTAGSRETLTASTLTVTQKISASLQCVVLDPSRHPRGPYIGLYVLMWGDPARDANATALVNTYTRTGQFPANAQTCLLTRSK